MYYCHTRYYVPKWLRWLNSDNVEYLDTDDFAGINLFVYCGNNPVIAADPDGNKWYNPFSWSNKTKIIVGVAFIAIGLIATVATGGALAPALLATIQTVATSVAVGAAVGAATGGIVAAINGEDIVQGMINGAKDGAVDGFMWGGIAAGAGNVIKAIGNTAWASRTINMTSDSKNFLFKNNNGDLTIFRNGNKFRFDYGVSESWHYHMRFGGGIAKHRKALINGFYYGGLAAFSLIDQVFRRDNNE